MFVTRTPRLIAASALVIAAIAPTCLAQPGANDAAAQRPDQLIEVLEKADATPFEKAKACQRLAVVGGKEAIPALTALLADETLNLYARTGLEGIADPAVDEAFRDAATRLSGRQLVGVIDSMGQRRDQGAVELLGRMLGHDDAAVASAAAAALGKVASPPASAALLKALAKSKDNPGIADGCLACADGLALAGRTDDAVKLYREVADADLPKRLKIAALRGRFRAEGRDASELLIEQIRSQDQDYFRLGLAVGRELGGDDVTTALADEIPALAPERQALVLLALGDRQDAAPLPVVVAASKSEYPVVREAAIRVLAKVGDASAAAILLDAALGEGEVAATAQERLKGLQGGEVDSAIASRLSSAEATDRLVLFDLAAARRIAAALPAVKKALSSEDEPTRLAAIAALGQLVQVDELDLLVGKALAEGGSAETAASQLALRTAVLRLGDREASAEKLAAKLDSIEGENRVYLIDLLGQVSGDKALKTIVAAVANDDPAIKDAATRVLGDWANADAAPALLEIAKGDGEAKYRVRAIRGYLRIARQLQLPPEEKLAMFETAMKVAERDEDKQLALDVLTRIPSAQTLELAVSYLEQPALAEAAAEAAVKIAPKLPASESKAVAAAMQKIVDAGVGGNSGARAKQLLDQAKSG